MMTPEKTADVERRIQKIHDNTAEDVKLMWPFKPYYDEVKDVIILPQPQKKKDGTLKGGVLHQIVGRERAIEVDGYKRAAVQGMLRASGADTRRQAYSMVVEKQTRRALADDGNVQAAVFVAKAIGAFQKVEENRVDPGTIQINISPEIAREILDRMLSSAKVKARPALENVIDVE